MNWIYLQLPILHNDQLNMETIRGKTKKILVSWITCIYLYSNLHQPDLQNFCPLRELQNGKYLYESSNWLAILWHSNSVKMLYLFAIRRKLQFCWDSLWTNFLKFYPDFKNFQCLQIGYKLLHRPKSISGVLNTYYL